MDHFRFLECLKSSLVTLRGFLNRQRLKNLISRNKACVYIMYIFFMNMNVLFTINICRNTGNIRQGRSRNDALVTYSMN